MSSGTEACSACSLGLLSLECSGVGQGVHRGKQSIPRQRSPTGEVALAGGHGDEIVTGQRGTVEVRKAAAGVRSLPGQGS